MPNTRWWALIVVAVGVLTACAAATGPLEPLVVGWERIFKLDWEAVQVGGRPVVRGYVANDSPYTVTRVQLLVDALDDGGRLLGQQLGWVPGSMAAFDRRYFEVPAPTAAPTYRVRVFAYDRIESGDFFDR